MESINVLLLTVSTLPKAFDQTTAVYKTPTGEEITYDYYGQMEPVPMMLRDKLKGQGGALDTLLVLASKETKETVKGRDDIEKIAEITKIEDHEEITALSVFKNRMAIENVIAADKINTIEVDINSPREGVANTVEELRELKKKADREKKEFNLYLDMHGGLRENQLILDAIVSLLKVEGINVKESYTVHYEGKVSIIVSADESLELFDFVAGINEFLNYAKSNTLVKLFESSSNKDNQNKDLIDKITKVCDAIQLCQMQDFEDNLVELKTRLDEAASSNGGSYLDIFRATIENDYGVLLDKDKRTVCDMLRWCLRKEFYQQALTIVESRVPQELFDKNVIELKPMSLTLPGQQQDQQVLVDDYLSSYVDKEKDERNMAWKDWHNFVFENCVSCVVRRIQGERVYSDLNKLEAIRWNKWPRNSDRRFYEARIVMKDGSIHKPGISVCKDKNLDRFNRFAQLHMAFKNQRNLVNHASKETDRESIEVIKPALEKYVDMLEELFA